MKRKYIFILILALIVLNTPLLAKGAVNNPYLSGKILLQVEEKGEAWYVNPTDGKRHYLGRPSDAFEVMRGLGLGISESNFRKFNGFAPTHLSGRILLRVEDKGQAYYVDPKDLKMHYLGRPSDAFEVMRSLGLGISNVNLIKIRTWFAGEKVAVISPEDGKNKVSNFINKYLMKAGDTAVVGAVTKESGIYRMEIEMPNDQTVEVGLTLNGEKFFSQVHEANLTLTPSTDVSGNGSPLSQDAERKIEEYLDDNFLSGTNSSDVVKVELADGVFKISFTTQTGARIESYITTDGSKFFPQVIDIEEYVLKNTPLSQVSENMTQQARPHVELFVMSHCPYGLQMEKGLIPVLELLEDKIDFELKFVDYAMHGRKEIDEQLVQHCIQSDYKEELIPYLQCFAGGESSIECMDKNGIDKTAVSDCSARTDEEYSITELYNDKNTWRSGRFPLFPLNNADVKVYGIKGSPVLVVNGETVSSARDSNTLLKAICSAFTAAPDECAKTLSSETPAPGFGTETSTSASSNSCAQ